MVIGFDFDKVFINYPPFVPYGFIDFLYKGSGVFNKNNKHKLSYRLPGLFEQKIRIISHYPIFRQPLKKNIQYLKKITAEKKCTTYLVSSRFGFLQKRTNVILSKYKLNKYFDGIYFNYENIQPHKFKEETIHKLNIDTYVDDDLDLALYLSKKMPSLIIYWVKNEINNNTSLPSNVIPINDLSELYKNLYKT